MRKITAVVLAMAVICGMAVYAGAAGTGRFHYGNGLSWGMTQQEVMEALMSGGDRDRLLIYDMTREFAADIPPEYRNTAWAFGVEGILLDGPSGETVVMSCIGTGETGLYTILYYLFWLEDETGGLPFRRAEEICAELESAYGMRFSEDTGTPDGASAGEASLFCRTTMLADETAVQVSVDTDGTYRFVMIVFESPEAPAFAENEDIPQSESQDAGDYSYEILPDGSAGIVRYLGSASQLVIPDSLDGIPVTRLGEKSFAYSNSLVSVTVPEGVSEIGGAAFSSCPNLSSVVLPDSVTTVGANPFEGCSRLSRIDVSPEHSCLEVREGVLFCKTDRRLVFCPESVAGSGYSVPEGTEIIGDAAFFSLTGMEEITLPDGLVRIGEYAFSNCIGLKAANLPDTVTSVGDYAFNYCISLEEAVLPEGVTDLGSYVFNECSGLVRVSLPDSLVRIGNNPFTGCTGLAEIALSPDHPELAMTDGTLFSTADRRIVYVSPAIAADRYVIPEGTRIIGGHAFYACGAIFFMEIPDSVTGIGMGAFADCTSLTEIVLPAGITEISDFQFSGCESLRDIVIPDGVARIGDQAFCGCGALVSVTIPDSVTWIDTEAFLGCSSLKSISLPDRVRRIGDRAFGFCDSLSSVALPDSVEDMGMDPFIRCDRLTEIAVSPDHPYLEIVEGVLFTRPDRRLVSYPFALEAESYAVPEGTEIIGGFAFYENTALKSVLLPDGLRSIGEAAFAESPSLEEIMIPESVTEIGSGAFFWSDRLVLTVRSGSEGERYCFANRVPYRTAE